MSRTRPTASRSLHLLLVSQHCVFARALSWFITDSTRSRCASPHRRILRTRTTDEHLCLLVQNVDGFSANVVAKFFGFLPGPPAFWTLSAAATQIAGSAALAVGVLSRPVAANMAATMAAAKHSCETPARAPLGLSGKAEPAAYSDPNICGIGRPVGLQYETAPLGD